ncbi:hypothetical protein [Alicyclobacillus fodiniaquatilis]|jgi:hypothetical protein|uniref:Tetratricopeptide repeat protein n=1 Tax=Alicyclobacillus fodiniaquatilis TaxID=1661150 RepID=A0ABW4JDP6_9BACL
MQNELELAATHLVANAIDTVRERIADEAVITRLNEAEQQYLTRRDKHPQAAADELQAQIELDAALWPLRLYLADAHLQSGETNGFEHEVHTALGKSRDPFVVVSIFMYMTRLFVMRSRSAEEAVVYVREAIETNVGIASYIRGIYIQTLLEVEDFEEAYRQIQISIHENNPMLTIEGLEIWPILMARLGKWQDQDEVIRDIRMFAAEQLQEWERNQLVQALVGDVAEREQVGDTETARFLLEVARTIDDTHPAVTGYLSIDVQMPKGWWPVQ